MKNLVPYLAILLAFGLSACKERAVRPEETTNGNPAMEFYYKYADNADLTVAYLGNLSVNGKCIDTVMLQADNETDWDVLKHDFGFMPYDTTALNCPSDDNPVMVGVGIETDFLDDAIFDTVSDISQIPDKDIERFTLIVADKMREVMNSFQSPDSLLPNTAIITAADNEERALWLFFYDDQEECNTIINHISEDMIF